MQLTEQDLAEELQDGSFSFHAGVDTAVAVQCLLAAMEPSWNRNKVIEKHYPAHLDLQSASGDTGSAAKPAPAAETSSGKPGTVSDGVSASGDTISTVKPAAVAETSSGKPGTMSDGVSASGDTSSAAKPAAVA